MTDSRFAPALTVVLFGAILVIAPYARGSADSSEPAVDDVESSVVKIVVHSSPPDLLSPWQRAGIAAASGSGVIIEGDRILTNAHVVADAVSIEVQRAGKSERYAARPSFVGHDCDLALLEVDDGRFFAGARQLRVGDMPAVQDAVQVHGFPIGGETISVTSGIISRVEVSTYVHSMEYLLLAQVDAPVNEGNSGGPVIADGSIVGIASQALDEAENVGYMIPAPIIAHFLDDLADGTYDGFPRLGVDFQDLESEAQRASLGMKGGQTGALVGRVDHGSPADAILRMGDVLLAIDGHTIANDATVQRPRLGRVHLSEVFQAKQIGETLDLSVLRDGKRISTGVRLTPHQFLIPGRGGEGAPEYFVFGGLVFQPLTFEYLTYFEELPADLANLALFHNVVTEDRAQVILIQKVLPHAVNRGYHDWEDYVVQTVNGVPPRDMEHLARIVDDADGPWLKIVTAIGSHLTLGLPEARSAQTTILASFGIATDRSLAPTRDTLTARAKTGRTTRPHGVRSASVSREPRRRLYRGIARDLWRTLPDLVLVDLLTKIAIGVTLVPATTWLSRALIASSGDRAIGNFDIFFFVLSLRGMLAVLIAGVVIVAVGYLGSAGLFYIAYAALQDRRVPWQQALRLVLRRVVPFLETALATVLAMALAVLPFLLAGGLVYRLLLSGHDINYYLAERPPEFRAALWIGAALLAGAVVCAVVVYLAVVFALPNVLLRGVRIRAAFGSSLVLVRRNLRLLAGPLLGWLVLWTVGTVLVEFVALKIGGLVVAATGQSLSLLVPLLGLLAVLGALIAAALTFIYVAVHSLLLARLYREICERLSIPLPPVEGEVRGSRREWRIRGRLTLAGLLIVLSVALVVGYTWIGKDFAETPVAVTAHRGSSLAAPENTLAAIERAVADGADYVEIDVQLTADGVVVVNHDADLMRVGRVPRVVTASTYADLAGIDIGSWFGPEFADERLPTLEQAIEVVRGRARLDVEIKSYAADAKRLVAEVAETLRRHGVAEEFAVMSLKYGEIRELRRIAPEIKAGYCLSTAIGTPEQLDVDFLAVSAGRASNALIAAAHSRDREVWVWTVDDPARMSRMIDLGVDNVITNVPEVMREVLDERDALEPAERLLLRFQHLYLD